MIALHNYNCRISVIFTIFSGGDIENITQEKETEILHHANMMTALAKELCHNAVLVPVCCLTIIQVIIIEPASIRLTNILTIIG